MNEIHKNSPLLCLCLTFLMLCCHGCLFGGNKKKERTPVYPVTTMTAPQTTPQEKYEEEEAARQERQLRTYRREMDKHFRQFSQGMKEAQEDLIVRIIALEEDYQQIKEKLSLMEFFQDESSKDRAKLQERLEFEFETLREQIDDYNTLLVKILDKISIVPESTAYPEEFVSPANPEAGP